MKDEQLYNQNIRYVATKWLLHLFQRYCKGDATEQEQMLVESWNPETNRELNKIEEQQVRDGCDQVWQLLTQKYALTDKQTPTVSFPGKWKRFGFRTAAIAAVVTLMLVLSGSLYLLNYSQEISRKETHTVACSKKSFETARSIKRITFPDGSVAHINYHTKLSFVPDSYNKGKREVWLEEGEAFFEVTKNPEKPFIVHHGELQTIVRGTSFNIKAYKELKEETITVRTGKVEVRSKDTLLGTLTKDKQIIYDAKTRNFYQEEIENESIAAWVDHRLVLYHANSSELKLRIKQFFNKDVSCNDDVLPDVLFYARFPKEATAQDVLTVISELYDVKYEIQEHQIRIYK